MINKCKNTYLGMCLLVLFYPACSLGDSLDAVLIEKVQEAANQEIEDSKTPSLQISIGIGSEIVYQGAFGVSDLENNVKATPATKYRTASVIKWMTATAAIRLNEIGKLDLDKPVQAYCPQFPLKKWEITSRQLLTHTSGVRHYIDYESAISTAKSKKEKIFLEKNKLNETVSGYTRFTDVISPLETFKESPLLFKPGAGWEYTSFGYRLLACVMQGASGENYSDLMRHIIFEPALMYDTVPDDSWAIIPHRAAGYRLERGGNIRRADMRDVSENLPAGGYLSTSTDLVKFALAFNSGLVSNKSRKLMSSSLRADDETKNVEQSWRDAIPSKEKYGYGLMLFSNYHEGMVGHTGRQAGASAIVVLLPDKDMAIAIMTNAKGWNGYLSLATKLNSIMEL